MYSLICSFLIFITYTHPMMVVESQDEFEFATLGQFPWHVALLSKNHNLICGGSIISEVHIITSAHCALKLSEGLILMGCLNFSSNSFDKCQMKNIKNIIEHPIYSGVSSDYDIAIIESDKKIDFSDIISKIRLSAHTYSRNFIRFCGYDNPPMLYGDHLNKTLLFSDLKFVNDSECISSESGNHIKNLENIICLDTKSNNNRPPCMGDTGGGILIQPASGEWLQIGIISQYLGSTCTSGDKVIGVNLNLSLAWISKVIEEDEESSGEIDNLQ